MAKHSLRTLASKGFTLDDLEILTSYGYLSQPDSNGNVWTIKAPSSWPKQFKVIWDSHAPRHGNQVSRLTFHIPASS